ncbi:putative serine/threonine-protein kinase [Trichinella nativa]|uniref:non-specific serine/threonine protein kinase n=1 Tax=Trichinella nativa TaxID=6335 RepID=A0A0V1KUC2_9BILA|nr:putative serine/threonine-protein kinase [Trichinella nativa]
MHSLLPTVDLLQFEVNIMELVSNSEAFEIFLVYFLLTIAPHLMNNATKAISYFCLNRNKYANIKKKKVDELYDKLKGINIMQQFAEHSRMTRQLSIAKRNYDKAIIDDKFRVLKFRFGIAFAFYITMVVIICWILYNYYGRAILIFPKTWFGPFNRVLSFPAVSDTAEEESDSLSFLEEGMLLKDQWLILEKLGSGNFGAVYKCEDQSTKEIVAVKAEDANRDESALALEIHILKLLQGGKHICQLYSYGTCFGLHFMIISLLGKSVWELQTETPDGQFSISTYLRISVQSLHALEALHSVGYVHRDVKTDNLTIGYGEVEQRRIYLIDFGLAKRYTDENGNVRQPRRKPGFRGTSTYASISAHKQKELGRVDDLWSWLYTTMEMASGHLPWNGLKKKKLLEAKITFGVEDICQVLPIEFKEIFLHLLSLTYYDCPNYDFISKMIQNAFKRLGYCKSDPYDWETAADVKQSELNTESEVNRDEEKQLLS